MGLYLGYITLVGFYTCWRFRNSFLALIAIAPLAMIPGLLSEPVSELINWMVAASVGRGLEVDRLAAVRWWAQFGLLTVGSSIALWAAQRWGRTVMGPAAAPRLAATDGGSADAKSAPVGWVASSPAPLAGPLAGLIWQSWRANRTVWCILALSSAVGCVGLLLVPDEVRQRPAAPTSVRSGAWAQSLAAWAGQACLIGYLGISWLGVFAFGGDGASARMRFLADRGVSPSLAWYSRHACSLAWLSGLLAIYGLDTLGWLPWNASQATVGGVNLRLSMLTVLLVVATIYGVSQWVSQSLRPLAASFAAAPLLSGLAVSWLVYCWLELAVGTGWCLLAIAVPWVATWLLMRWHMDDVSSARMLAVSPAVPLAMVLLPLLPVVHDWWRYPRLPAAMIAQWSAEAQAYPPAVRAQPMPWPTEPAQPVGDQATSGDKLPFWEDSLATRWFAMEADNRNLSPWLVDGHLLKRLLAATTLARLQLQYAASNPAEIAAARERLTQQMVGLTGLARQLRSSERWLDQLAADEVEIWLATSLANDDLADLRSAVPLRPTVGMLADREARQTARRRAVLRSWSEFVQADSQRNSARDVAAPWQLGGIDFIDYAGDVPSPLRGVYRTLIANQLVAATLLLIDSPPASTSQTAALRQLHQLTQPATLAFEDGFYGPHLRLETPDQAYPPPTRHWPFAPAAQWQAGWESWAETWVAAPSGTDE